ncbi:GNAT family N-acetyltransferase [Streptomyces sp. K1PN6]|uniref:GNAT family N-acetyltransferase n=2 Tax=Streptomyces acidicola TaxID=2596892 RepID=A0A5N8WUG7_9ACTN|nr:GNAT family N-acetyltransferase [Streptomyces acidicola]
MVRSRADMDDFIKLPYQLYKAHPYWVAPLEVERRQFLNRRRNPYLRQSDVGYFLARRGRVPVGRVAAIIGPEGTASQCQGHVGFFECTDDQAVARSLWEQAVNWLRERDVQTVIGPMNPNMHHECGLLVEGFDDSPRIGMPYNPPYYTDLFTAGGFTPVKDLLSWRLSPTSRKLTAWAGYGDVLLRSRGLTVRSVDWRRFRSESGLVRELYHAGWQDNWGFAPATHAEFTYLARQVRLLAPTGARIVEHEGTPVGFSILLPDFNQALAPARGSLTRYGWPIGAWRVWRGRRAITRGRVMALGVPEDSRAKGAALALIADAVDSALAHGWNEIDVSWVLEDNQAANKLLVAIGATVHKRHRLYARCVRHSEPCSCLTALTHTAQEAVHAAHL